MQQRTQVANEDEGALQYFHVIEPQRRPISKCVQLEKGCNSKLCSGLIGKGQDLYFLDLRS